MIKLEKCAVAAVVKHGHDGNPPKFMPARGTKVIDPKTGKTIREATDGVQNVNIDVLERLLARRAIQSYQYDAGRYLERDWVQSLLIAYSQMGSPGGQGTVRLPDAKCDALKRFGDAKAFVSGMTKAPLWKLLEMTVLGCYPVEAAARVLGLKPKDSGVSHLSIALDILAKHYRLT